MEPKFFPTPADFRAWLEQNHDKEKELWVGFYNFKSGKLSITWPEAVDQALCFGWIDGLRKKVDDISYTNRFTPRKPDSNWSEVNTNRVQELTRLGLMQPAGLKAFERRSADQSYSDELRTTAALSETDEARFRANPQAWDFFQKQPNSYHKAAIWWVISAKQEKTRTSRLTQLIGDSATGKRIPPLTRYPKKA